MVFTFKSFEIFFFCFLFFTSGAGEIIRFGDIEGRRSQLHKASSTLDQRWLKGSHAKLLIITGKWAPYLRCARNKFQNSNMCVYVLFFPVVCWPHLPQCRLNFTHSSISLRYSVLQFIKPQNKMFLHDS